MDFDKAEAVVLLLKIIEKDTRPEPFSPIREKSVGHPDYPSIMPDLTGLA